MVKISLVLLLWALPVHAQELTLAWEFPRKAEPLGFVLSMSTASPTAVPVTSTIPPAPPAACVTIPDHVADTYCTRLTCPKPGVYRFFVEAQLTATELSLPSNTVTCAIQYGDNMCRCIVLQNEPPPPPPDPPFGGPPFGEPPPSPPPPPLPPNPFVPPVAPPAPPVVLA